MRQPLAAGRFPLVKKYVARRAESVFLKKIIFLI